MEFFALLLLTILLAGACAYLFHQNQKHKAQVAIKTKEIDTTSKTLIEKHMELMDNYDRLKGVLQTKSDFVSIASHQLRTPITDIKYGLTHLLDQPAGELSPTTEEQLKKLLGNANRMNHLIDELLDFVESEAGKTNRKKELVTLEKMIAAVVGIAQEHFKNRDVAVEFDFGFGPEGVLVDSGLIEIVFENLVHNAFHYTPDGKKMFIKTAKFEDKFYFEVRDEGVGIPKDKQDLIFGKFKRSPNAMKMNELGIGLGLHITKNIVDKMGGEIGFSSEGEGRGTTFYFTIPAKGG